MCAFAIFSLKYPTLIQGLKDIDVDEQNLKSPYYISKVTSDTQIRNIINEIDCKYINPLFIYEDFLY